MSEFTEHLSEVFAQFGEITTRKMFGGHGVYHGGVMFGLVADDTLYLKVDAQSKGEFAARGLSAFVYTAGKKPVEMSYWLAPEEIFEDAEEAALWARRAHAAAVRSGVGKGALRGKKKAKKRGRAG
ncbi:MAG: TfoX/Sxy family protein [Gammaproteobacteria bacterium]